MRISTLALVLAAVGGPALADPPTRPATAPAMPVVCLALRDVPLDQAARQLADQTAARVRVSSALLGRGPAVSLVTTDFEPLDVVAQRLAAELDAKVAVERVGGQWLVTFVAQGELLPGETPPPPPTAPPPVATESPTPSPTSTPPQHPTRVPTPLPTPSPAAPVELATATATPVPAMTATAAATPTAPATATPEATATAEPRPPAAPPSPPPATASATPTPARAAATAPRIGPDPLATRVRLTGGRQSLEQYLRQVASACGLQLALDSAVPPDTVLDVQADAPAREVLDHLSAAAAVSWRVDGQRLVVTVR